MSEKNSTWSIAVDWYWLLEMIEVSSGKWYGCRLCKYKLSDERVQEELDFVWI